MNAENHYQETDLGNISPNPRGEYSDAESYEYLDLVEYGGGSYLCLAELGTTIKGIAPASGKNTDSWQVITIPGGLTPEYVAMHDKVLNLSEQTAADAEETRTAREAVQSMETNVQQLQAQSTEAAVSAEASKDAAAGYAQAADISRQAAETARDDVNAQVTGFDSYVADKTAEAEKTIEAARMAANNAVVAQQDASVQAVKDETANYIKAKQAEAEAAIEKKAGDYAADVDADIQAVKDAGAVQISAIENAGANQTNAVNTSGSAQLKAVNDAGADQTNAVNAAGTTQVDAVNAAGAARMAEIRGSVADLAPAIKCTAAGTDITLRDASDAPLSGMRAYGRTEQMTTTGAQLFDIHIINGRTVAGKTFDILPDGGVHVYGTATEQAYTTPVEVILPAGTYFVSGSNLDSHVLFYASTRPKDESKPWHDIANGVVTVTESDKMRFYVNVNVGNNVDAIIYPMLNTGDVPLPYEPYTGGKPSPSPEYPQDLVSVGDKGSVEVMVRGKNLIPYPYRTKDGTFDGITCHINDDTSVDLSGTTTVGTNFYFAILELPRGIYTVVCRGDGSGPNLIAYDLEDGTYLGSVPLDGKDNKSFTFTTTKDTAKIQFYLNMNKAGIDVSGTVYPMLVVGEASGDEPYEPYTAQKLPISTPNGLRGIPVSSGGNYTDENGQQWIADYRDWERGVDVQMVVMFILTGNEFYVGTRDSSYFRGSSTNMYINPPGIRWKTSFTNVFCNKLSYVHSTWTVPGCVGVCANADQIHLRIPNTLIGVSDDASNDDKIAAFKAYIKQCYDNGDPYIVQYVLAIPVEKPIPPEELAAYRALHTNHPNTNITNDARAYMDVTYTADTVAYINNNYVPKATYEALEARVAALEQHAISL